MVRANIVLAVATPALPPLDAGLPPAMRSAVLAMPSPTPNRALAACGTCRLAPGCSSNASPNAAIAETNQPVRTSTLKPTRGRTRPLMALAIGQPITIA